MPEMLAHLPDVTFLANTFDQPRSWVAPLPPDVEAALADGSLAMEDAFRRHACDGAGYGHLKRTHGMLGSRQMWPWRRAAFPFFSNYALPGCFAGAPRVRACAFRAAPGQQPLLRGLRGLQGRLGGDIVPGEQVAGAARQRRVH